MEKEKNDEGSQQMTKRRQKKRSRGCKHNYIIILYIIAGSIHRIVFWICLKLCMNAFFQ